LTRLLLARVRAVLVVGLVGAVVAHVATPFAPGHAAAVPVAFLALMFALGLAFGALDAHLRARRGSALWLQGSAFGLLAVAVSLAAYQGLH